MYMGEIGIEKDETNAFDVLAVEKIPASSPELIRDEISRSRDGDIVISQNRKKRHMQTPKCVSGELEAAQIPVMSEIPTVQHKVHLRFIQRINNRVGKLFSAGKYLAIPQSTVCAIRGMYEVGVGDYRKTHKHTT
jgi:hypothetical protein